MASLLDGHKREEELRDVLKNKRFRIDPNTMKIVMEGEEGYEWAATPDPRKSVFAGRRASKLWAKPLQNDSEQ